eukprot:Hpha_TRINITY_DN4738_c0_g1::TRINITY_DN4738_c0_g1_i1::g.130533::m.130533/K09560/ST13; suppressor of tumorigenicity protein 13
MAVPDPMIESLREFAQLLESDEAVFWHPRLDVLRSALLMLGCSLPVRPKTTPTTPVTERSAGAAEAAAGGAAAGEAGGGEAAADAAGERSEEAGSRKRKRTEAETAAEEAAQAAARVAEEAAKEEEEPLPEYPTNVDEGADLWEREDADSLYRIVAKESREYTDEDREAAMSCRSAGMELLSEGKHDDAVSKLTEGLCRDPRIAPLWAARASTYLRQRRPVCAIRDCDEALQINADQPKALRVRGQARCHLGEWEAAAADLHKANAIDFDPDIGQMLRDVEKRTNLIREWRLAKERVERNREAQQKKQQLLKRQAELRAQRVRELEEEAEERRKEEEKMGTEMRGAMQDPDVRAALEAVRRGDKSRVLELVQRNPKVGAVLEALGYIKVSRGPAPPGAAPTHPAAAHPAAAAAASGPGPVSYDDLD